MRDWSSDVCSSELGRASIDSEYSGVSMQQGLYNVLGRLLAVAPEERAHRIHLLRAVTFPSTTRSTSFSSTVGLSMTPRMCTPTFAVPPRAELSPNPK